MIKKLFLGLGILIMGAIFAVLALSCFLIEDIKDMWKNRKVFK